jgi:deoxycytidine triphosphate deaminase
VDEWNAGIWRLFTMTLLRDKDIYDEILAGRIVVSGLAKQDISYEYLNSPIQACSLDLHVGEIFRPTWAAPGSSRGMDESEEFCLSGPRPNCGDTSSGQDEYILRPGETVLVTTKEELEMPANLGGIAFPPSGLASKALLTTNPGHIDPGYTGQIHLTIINMGRACETVRKGDRIVTLLLFRLEANVDFDFEARRSQDDALNLQTGCQHENRMKGTHQKPAFVDNLAPDFMDFKRTTKRIAATIAQSETRREKIAGAIVGTLLTIGMIVYGIITQTQYGKLDAQINTMQQKIALADRMHDLETRLSIGRIGEDSRGSGTPAVESQSEAVDSNDVMKEGS